MYVPVPHLGWGWVQVCVSILEGFPSDTIGPVLYIPRTFRAIARTVSVREAVPHIVPFRYAACFSRSILNYRFRRALATAEPDSTIVYFWPSPPLSMVRYARKRGFITVREMINTCINSAQVILDDAYDRLGLTAVRPPRVSKEAADREQEELGLHNYIMSPNRRIDDSLVSIGIHQTKILRSTYGWSPSRIDSKRNLSKDRFRLLFVGGDTIRKGLPQLLAAWKRSNVSGELVVVGKVEPILHPIVAPYLERNDIRIVEFVQDLGPLYKSSDAFVLPSLEEGDPLVTYEAAASGLPIIATPMGSASILKHGHNGFVVQPYDIDELAEAIARLANSPEMRKQMGYQAAKDAQEFRLDKIGESRAKILNQLLADALKAAKRH